MKIIVNGEVVEAGGGGGSSAGEVYTTEETRIGTWINGKPLYRAVYELMSPSAKNAEIEVSPPIASIDQPVNIYGFLRHSNPIYLMPVNFTNLLAGTSIVTYLKNKSLCMIVSNVEYAGRPTTIVLEYTKTTD